ncbi:MAG: AraC family transcriptional regulator [Rhodococcus sp. (in: high G+C Gram-positive bacteria)]
MSEIFRLPATGEADRRDAWQGMLSKTHLPWTTQLSVPEQEFDAAVQRWWIDDLALVDCVCGPTSGTRQRRHIADTDGEFFVVMMNRGGRETISYGDDSVRIGSGDVVFWDSSLPARFAVHEWLSKRSLIVPFSAIDKYIEQNLLGGELSLDAIAEAHAVSVRTVNGAYSATGQTVGGIIRSRRLARARQELAETDQSLARIAGRLGFSDASHLSRAFKAFYGLAPSDFRERGA